MEGARNREEDEEREHVRLCKRENVCGVGGGGREQVSEVVKGVGEKESEGEIDTVWRE